MAILAWTNVGVAAPADDLNAGAKKEGVIDFYGPSTLGPEGAQAIVSAFNKKYGLNVKVNFTPSGNMTRDTAKVIGLSASGQPPEWDIMLVTDAHHGSLWLRKLQKSFDYTTLGVAKQRIEYDNGTVSVANQFALPAYNTKLLPAKDVPKRWEDLLDPKWKGKIGVINSTHHWGRLAAGAWGDEKTLDFIKKLSAQKPLLTRAGEMAQRLILGEVLVSATLQDSQLHEAKESGAPLAFAEEVSPVVSPEYHVGVLKNSAHPERRPSHGGVHGFRGSPAGVGKIYRSHLRVRAWNDGLQIRARQASDLHETGPGRQGRQNIAADRQDPRVRLKTL